ncbi:hypothetical protein [Catenulispora subtropica]|uniref:Uncharacterized protein n=1 Tax=Catenulispora subtropica TaxID=450798 RepID=A0ABP5DBT3_9ACTN
MRPEVPDVTDPPDGEEYREPRSALSGRLIACGGLLPALLVAAAVVLGIAADPVWFVAVPVVLLAPPFSIAISLLMRNRRTGIVVGDAGLTVGALGAARGAYLIPWSAIDTTRIETSPRLVDAMMRARRIFSPTRYWGVPRRMADFTIPAGVLVPPFARAVLVVELAEATSVVGEPPPPRRYFGNYLNVNSFSRSYRTEVSSLWLVPTRHPDRLALALAEHGFS